MKFKLPPGLQTDNHKLPLGYPWFQKPGIGWATARLAG